jgi:Arc/MetJ-type ribon-helix-helix transcriptional regulator
MKSESSQKVTISLPPEALKYADRYRETHGLNTRSEVMTLALKLLREKELAEGYRAQAQALEASSDPWLDSDLQETANEAERG